MSVGLYGTKKLSDVDSSDVDILYAYVPNRETLGDLQLRPLYGNLTNNDLKKMIGADGAYKLRLPANVFNQLGYYTVLIKPRTFETTILDCSIIVTTNNNDIQISKKGIVIPKLNFQGTGSLIGYQIEYFDKNGVKIKNFHRIVTSSDPVRVNPNSNVSLAGATTYVLDSNGSSLFLNLTPDESSLVTELQATNLGEAGQKILISNTFIDPVLIEIEMVDQTIKTLSYAPYGNSTRDNEKGIYTIYDESGNIYKQYNLYQRKKELSNGIIDIKEERTQINTTQNFTDLTQGL